MGKLRSLYKKLSSIPYSALLEADQLAITTNEHALRELESEIIDICRKYMKQGVEFDFTARLSSSETGSVHMEMHNNLVD